MATLKGWVAAHTGLPSIVPGSAGLLWAGERLLAVVDSAHASVPVSDPLAPVGEPVTYRLGSATARLTRALPPGAVAGLGAVTTQEGRTVPGLHWVNDRAQTSYPSSVSVSGTLAVRWPLVDPPATGSSDLVLLDPQRMPDALALLRAHAPVVLVAPPSTPGVPPVRLVVVTALSSQRVGAAGQTWLKISWSEHVPPAGAAGQGCAAPVVTWGEWQAHDHGWAHRTYTQLCRQIAGMP